MPTSRPGDPASTLILVGGGLANGLIAIRLAERRPEVSVTMLEAGPRIGGEHTWSVFDGDIPAASAAWVQPLFAHRWPAYEVRFPGHERRLSMGYASLTSASLQDAVAVALGERVILNAPVIEVAAGSARLEDGRVFTADAVIDGRGPGPLPHLAMGFQKFLGREVELDADHGLSAPIIMDATVGQEDGYRFLYVLPLGPRRLLIEDTRYADGPELDDDALRFGVSAYAEAKGWRITEVVREERGVLPVALDGDIEAHWRAAQGLARSGLRAALFHPTTGYSLPDAVRLAEAIAVLPHISAEAVERTTRTLSTSLWRARGFYRRLNRMLFRAADPDLRYKVLKRFYRLPAPLIGRFYAGRTTIADQVRILSGWPPVPVGRALSCWTETGRA